VPGGQEGPLLVFGGAGKGKKKRGFFCFWVVGPEEKGESGVKGGGFCLGGKKLGEKGEGSQGFKFALRGGGKGVKQGPNLDKKGMCRYGEGGKVLFEK